MPEPSMYKFCWVAFNLVVIIGVFAYLFYVPYVLKKILAKIEGIEKFIKENHLDK
ncbi:MAG: hypothetical protein GX295_03825 [Syntrophomonadaceae bacterium]|nr:hypothetical protein [Syntrophomonadaceae bacterium]